MAFPNFRLLISLDVFKIVLQNLDVFILKLSEDFCGLDCSLCCDQKDSDQEVDLAGLVGLVLHEKERLIHEVGQVCNCWNSIKIESNNCNAFKKLANWVFGGLSLKWLGFGNYCDLGSFVRLWQ